MASRPYRLRSEKEKRRNRERMAERRKTGKAQRLRAAWMKKNPDANTRYRETAARDVQQEMLRASRQRAKEKGIPHTITKHDIIVPKRCPVFGVALRKGKGVLHDYSPTLDRIKPRLGYVPGNVRVISYKANRARGNLTLPELRRLVKFLEVNT